jgi:hypothetical protein
MEKDMDEDYKNGWEGQSIERRPFVEAPIEDEERYEEEQKWATLDKLSITSKMASPGWI